MTDKELAECVLAVDVWTFCYCRGWGVVKCKAHQRLLTLAKDVRTKVLADVATAIRDERVSGATGDEGDKAYNLALEHALDAVAALPTSEAAQ